MKVVYNISTALYSMARSHFKWKRLVKGDVIITDQSRQEHDSVCLSFWLWMLLKLFDCQYLFQYSKVAARLPKVSLLPPCATAANWEQAQCLCLPQSCPSDQQRLCQKVTRNQSPASDFALKPLIAFWTNLGAHILPPDLWVVKVLWWAFISSESTN